MKRSGDWLTMDFPAWQTAPVQPPALLLSGLGIDGAQAFRLGRDYTVVLENEQQVAATAPDIHAMLPLEKMVCVTAPGDEVDFVSRFFCPGEAVSEDPVTGSAHSMLIPYWGERLGKSRCRRGRSPPAAACCAANGGATGCLSAARPEPT